MMKLWWLWLALAFGVLAGYQGGLDERKEAEWCSANPVACKQKAADEEARIDAGAAAYVAAKAERMRHDFCADLGNRPDRYCGDR
jgi:hypothetical protein